MIKHEEPAGQKSSLEIPLTTLLKITAYALLVLSVIRLVPLLMICFLALLLAVASEPILVRAEKFLPRWSAITLLMTTITSILVGLGVYISPPFYDQAGRILQKIPTAGPALLSHLPPEGAIHRLGEKIASMPMPKVESWAPQILTFGEMALGAFTSLILLLVLMTYLLVDGRNTWRWLVAFFKPANRRKLEQTAAEVTPVVSAYIVGQIITSILCAIAVYIILISFSVPAALVLAVLAAIFDVLPIIGFIMTIVPAVLFALTVSPTAAVAVFFLFGAYHALENYVIVPAIYGNRLKVSGLVVLLAILAGVSLGGIVGAILILPVIASYPIIERIWLASYVGARAVTEHGDH